MNTIVAVETSLGNFEVELFDEQAPITVKNFLSYVDEGFYAGTIFHRVIDGFMIQGGGFTPQMDQKPTKAPIKNEATNGLKNDKYTIAMARTMIVDSATCQFFINTVDNSYLNHRTPDPNGFGYCVFGKVISGTNTIDQISKVATGFSGRHENVPTTPVIINKITRKPQAN